ncbi:small acid-soluble spore protein P [Paenibacillus turpanensis]|uniref:small acid-soluble spore protein P n=1 Tax=Paenibacillus turpanensis TaxID=2689078 RepID=UPI001FB759FF|nr:small acid-soluble spore protein P [Paenibacillus turpanensis]
MAKHMTQIQNEPNHDREPLGRNPAQPNEPLSGSKAVKNGQHSRDKHGEGH